MTKYYLYIGPLSRGVFRFKKRQKLARFICTESFSFALTNKWEVTPYDRIDMDNHPHTEEITEEQALLELL